MYVVHSTTLRAQVKACRELKSVSGLAQDETCWSEILHAPEFILSVVQDGYKIPFSEIPEKKCLKIIYQPLNTLRS